MLRKLKTLAVALVAVFSMGALAASVAQGAATFHSENENTTLTATANETAIFVYKGTLTVECKTVTVSHELNLKGTTTTTALTLKPTYDECKDEIGLVAHVNMNGCDYLYTLTGNDDTDGPVHLDCPAGQSITIKITNSEGKELCTYHVAPQTPKGVATYGNQGAGTTRELIVNNELTGITATRTGSFVCGPATSTEAEYKGAVFLKGEKSFSSEHVGIWVT